MDKLLQPTKIMHVISHPYHDINAGLAKLPLKIVHGWVITYHSWMRIEIIIYALMSVLIQLISICKENAPGVYM